MAVGSNSLGLLFKVGVDAGDAQKAFQQLMATNKEFAKGVEDGMKAEMQAVAGLGSALKGTNADFDKAINQVNNFREGAQQIASGNVGAAIANLGKAMGGVGLAIGAALAELAVAAGIASKAFDTLLSTAREVGTESRDDFLKLQKSIEGVGGKLTEVDHAISQNLVKSVNDLHAVTTDLINEFLRVSGPALIASIKLIGKELELLKPILTVLGELMFRTLAGGLILMLALQKSALDQLTLGYVRVIDNIKSARDEVRKLLAEPLTGDLGDKGDKRAKTVKESNDNFEREVNARIDLLKANIVREQQIFDVQTQEIKDAYAARTITAEEASERQQAAANKLLAVLDFNHTAIALLQTRDGELESERQAREQEMANQRVVNAQKILAATKEFNDALRKADEERLKRIDTILKGEKLLDEIIRERARAAPPGAPLGVEGQVPGLPAEIKLPKPVGGFFDDLQKSLLQSIDTFSTWGDLVGQVLGKFAQAAEQAFAAFILTGKLGGQIFKQLVASIIASVAIESAVKAIFQLAEGFAALAAHDPISATLHFKSAAVYGTVAAVAGAIGVGIGAHGGLGGDTAGAAAGGGGFGGEAAPGTVTINQGAGGPLGIQVQQLHALNNISNKLDTASPGDVLTRGADQNPMVIGQANNEASRRDGSISREFLQISGLRTA